MHTDTNTYRHRQTDRHTHRDIHIHRNTYIDTHTQITHRHAQKHVYRHTHRGVSERNREEQSIGHRKVTQLVVQLSGSLLVISEVEVERQEAL
jgi:sensor histidine kinase regulating citrate/malate metabolism